MTAAMLRLENIETYYGPIMAIRGISLEVFAGQIVTILGANGAGKTTVLKTISGALDPQKGQVIFEGRQIQTWDPDRVARLGVAHVPEGREVFPFLNVETNILLGAYSRNDDRIRDDLALVYDYFPVLREHRTQAAGLLSGGQQQMLAIGRALMLRPKLMLLDEPSLGLSPALVVEISRIVRRLRDEQQVTVVLVEQNAAMALEIGDFGFVMELGRVVMEDGCERLRQSTDIQEFYLGMKEEGTREVRRWKQRKTWR